MNELTPTEIAFLNEVNSLMIQISSARRDFYNFEIVVKNVEQLLGQWLIYLFVLLIGLSVNSFCHWKCQETNSLNMEFWN